MTLTDRTPVTEPDPAGPQSTPRPETDRRGPRSTLFLMITAALVVFNLAYALPTYLQFDPLKSRTVLDPDFPGHFTVVVIHVLTGNLALLTLAFQIVPAIRRKWPVWHRWSGRLYAFAGVVPATLTAFVLLPFSTAPGGKVGLGLMAAGWLATTVLAVVRARQRRWTEHRIWTAYSFALALGTTWGRLIASVTLPGQGIAVGLYFDLNSWAGWVLSILVAQIYIARRIAPPRGRPVTIAR